MATLEEQIKSIEEEIQRTPYNKATQHHIGKLKAKVARLKDEQETRRLKSGGGGPSYAVKKSGNATVGLVGFPSVGKSTLLNAITDATSAVAAYDFTTLDVIPGLLEHRGAKIQVLDMPGLIRGASKGRGRGKEVLSVARGCDLILLMIDVFETHVDVLEEELRLAGIRLNERPADVTLTKANRGGLRVNPTVKLTKLDEDLVADICREWGYLNGTIVVRQDITEDQLIDVLAGNRVYVQAFVVVNKIDLVSQDYVKGLQSKLPRWKLVPISAAEEERDRPLDVVHLDRQVPRTDRDARESLLTLRVDAGCPDDEIRILQRRRQVGEDPRGFEDLDSMHRTLTGLDAQRAGVDENQVACVEVLHRARDGANVALVLRLDQDDPSPGPHIRSIYPTRDIPWHAGRPQDRLRRPVVLRTPTATGSADR